MPKWRAPKKVMLYGREEVWIVEAVNNINEVQAEYKFQDFVTAYRFYLERKGTNG